MEQIATHSAFVFLVGDDAYKLKRAVRYPFMDMGTAARRQELVHAEITLNRRTAPELYLNVVPVRRRDDGRLSLGGSGTPVDWLVHMRRFPQEAMLDQLALAGRLTVEIIDRLADEVASLHDGAAVRADQGGGRAMRWIVDDNIAEFRELGELFPAHTIDALADASNAALDRLSPLLDARRARGHVRQCHGDLHLRNAVMIDGRPVLFDCIEFNDEIACTDTLYDLAFLCMDLEHRGLAVEANRALNRYLERRDECGGLALLPLFLSARAAVRAKVEALGIAGQSDAATAQQMTEEARAYLRRALAYHQPAAPLMIGVGGRSGTGKSTLARALAPDLGRAPGAVVLRSDVERKRIHGVAPETQLPEAAYAPAVSARVYRVLLDVAAHVLAQGHAVVVDAVFDRAADRAAAARVADDVGVPFVGLWLEAPESVLVDRIAGRAADASDADAAVVRRQGGIDPGEVTWTPLDAARPLDALAASAREQVRSHATDAPAGAPAM